MALLISGENITLNNGLTVTTAYARTNAALSIDGSQLVVGPAFWASEEAYNAKSQPLQPTNINVPMQVPYDRTVMGTDLLFAANEVVKQMLEVEGFTVTITEL
jgi:hypothetical protein